MNINLLHYVLDALRDTESGSLVSVESLTEGYGAPIKTDDLLEISNVLTAEAEGYHIYLESAFADVGMPYNSSYLVKRKYTAPYTKDDCIAVRYTAGGYMCVEPAIQTDIRKTETDQKSWGKLMKTVFDESHVMDWFDTYEDRNILDGSYWNLELAFRDGLVLRFHGSNSEPKGLHKLESTVSIWNITSKYDY